MLWFINRVSADQYHVTISRAQVMSMPLTQVRLLCWGEKEGVRVKANLGANQPLARCSLFFRHSYTIVFWKVPDIAYVISTILVTHSGPEK